MQWDSTRGAAAFLDTSVNSGDVFDFQVFTYMYSDQGGCKIHSSTRVFGLGPTKKQNAQPNMEIDLRWRNLNLN